MKKYLILNCPCYAVTSPEEVQDFILKKIKSQKGGYSAAINALKILKYNEDELTKKTIDNAMLQTPDGFGAQLAFKVLYRKRVIKLDLPGLILNLAHKHQLKVFFLGTTEENNYLAVEKIKSAYSNIEVVGRANGFFSNNNEIINKLEQTKPQIVMISMGSPKQEILSAEITNKLDNIIFIGSGGRLDILAGKLNRAPDILIKLNLEWLYRLIKEPKRIKQQLGLMKFLAKLFLAKSLSKST